MNELTTVPMTYWQTVFMHVIVSAPALLIAYMAYRAASKAKSVGMETKAAVNDIHISINSWMDQFLETTKKAGDRARRQAGRREARRQGCYLRRR